MAFDTALKLGASFEMRSYHFSHFTQATKYRKGRYYTSTKAPHCCRLTLYRCGFDGFCRHFAIASLAFFPHQTPPPSANGSIGLPRSSVRSQLFLKVTTKASPPGAILQGYRVQQIISLPTNRELDVYKRLHFLWTFTSLSFHADYISFNIASGLIESDIAMPPARHLFN